MKTFLDVVFNHLIIATVLTLILWVLGAVITTSINFFQWGMDARIFILLFTNLAAVFVQAGIKENELL